MRTIKLFTKSNCMRAKMIDVIRTTAGGRVYAAVNGSTLTVRTECTDAMYKKVKAEILDVLSPKLVVFG